MSPNANHSSLANSLTRVSEGVDEKTIGVLPGSLASEDRRLSRASIKFFQDQTAQLSLVGKDGKLSDDYILKRQSINKPATLKSIPLLADLTSNITEIDGWVMTQLLVSGYAKMASKIDELNKINVFPIADGDTGANMKVCLKLPTRNLLLHPSESLLQVASNIAADVLLNGQGNSGTILSHFFVSLAESIKTYGKECLSVNEFASMLSTTGKAMNEAVSNPVEGTLLSVARDCCQLEGNYTTLGDLVERWNVQAQDELRKTPDQLVVDGVKVLEKAGVVDSGAQGFVYLVEGMYLAVQGKLPEAFDPDLFKSAINRSASGPDEHEVDHTVCDSKHQFCTEAVILLRDGCCKNDVLQCMTCEYGDSVACVAAPAKEGGDMVKVHIHSNEPQKVFDKLRTFSRYPDLKKEKVEDMWAMRQDMHGTADRAAGLEDAKFCIIGLSRMALPPQYQSDELGTFPAFVVPSDTQEPIDMRFTSATDACVALNAQRHKETAIRYTTATGNPMQIKIELLSLLSKGKPILAFVMSKDKRVSAMGRNIQAAIEMLTPEQQAMIHVVVHGWGFSEGLFIREAIECAKHGMTVEEAEVVCTTLADRNSFFLSFMGSPSVKKLAAWRPGLFPEGFQIEDDQVFAFGQDPIIREGEPWPEMKRVGAILNLLDKGPSMDVVAKVEIQRIKNTLKEGQSIASMMISCVGRPDIGRDFVVALRTAGVPLADEPIVYNAGLFAVVSSGWGELTISYKVV